MSFVLVVLATFAGMELVSYATHRWVMHRIGIVLHRSHHRAGPPRWEANDLFPVMFSIVGITLFASATIGGAGWLLPVAIGVTLYGVAYAFVHDVYIHGRLPLRVRESRYLIWVRDAHQLHHRFNGEPYGMLLPVVPRELRERAAVRDEIRATRSRL